MAEQSRKFIDAVTERPTNYDQDKYLSHLIDQYKIYVEMVDRLSARRVLVNNSFITLVGGAAVAFSAARNYFPAFATVFQLGISFGTILIGVLWHQTIMYYRDLSSTKFEVIHEIEELLPAQPYRSESIKFIKVREKRLNPLTRSLSRMESILPIFVVLISMGGFLYTLVLQRNEIWKSLAEFWKAFN